MTLVVHNPQRLYPLACREHPERLGVRLIEGPLAGAACAILQTSANRSGEPAPSRFGDIDARILEAPTWRSMAASSAASPRPWWI